jgi:putative transposase
MILVSSLFLLIRSLIVSPTALAVENLALRQQLAVLNRKFHRPQLHRRDRFFWVILSQLWKNWREVLIIVKPETVIKWHRQGFKLYWRWKSRAARCSRNSLIVQFLPSGLRNTFGRLE